MSGRKGFGVKADDLIDRLIAAAKKEVDPRHPELREHERLEIATQIAIGALRYFMLKFTKTTVIAFDFKEALSFEGETGPYAQYAVVRATNIFRKAGITPEAALSQRLRLQSNFSNRLEHRQRTLGALARRLENLVTSSSSASRPPSPPTPPSTLSSWRS